MKKLLLFSCLVSVLFYCYEQSAEAQTKPKKTQSKQDKNKLKVIALKPGEELAETLVAIDGPNAKETIASAINAHGDIVGRYTDQNDRVHGFLLDRHGRFQTLDNPTPGTTLTVARGINDSGDIVGQYRTADGVRHAYILSKGQYKTLDYPGVPAVTETFAWNINNDGIVVGQIVFAGSGGTHGFILNGSVWSQIDYPQSKQTAASGINSTGEIVGKWTGMDDKEHGFFLKQGRFTSIDVPDSIHTIVDTILDSRTIAGTFTDKNNVHRGFVISKLTDTGRFASVKTVDFPGLTVVRGINVRGDLVGLYVDVDGKKHGYVIRSNLRRKSAKSN